MILIKHGWKAPSRRGETRHLELVAARNSEEHIFPTRSCAPYHGSRRATLLMPTSASAASRWWYRRRIGGSTTTEQRGVKWLVYHNLSVAPKLTLALAKVETNSVSTTTCTATVLIHVIAIESVCCYIARKRGGFNVKSRSRQAIYVEGPTVSIVRTIPEKLGLLYPQQSSSLTRDGTTLSASACREVVQETGARDNDIGLPVQTDRRSSPTCQVRERATINTHLDRS